MSHPDPMFQPLHAPPPLDRRVRRRKICLSLLVLSLLIGSRFVIKTINEYRVLSQLQKRGVYVYRDHTPGLRSIYSLIPIDFEYRYLGAAFTSPCKWYNRLGPPLNPNRAINSDEEIRLISQLSSLESLSLKNEKIDENRLADLQRLRNLKHLGVELPNLSMGGLQKICRLKQLQSLCLNRVPIDDESVAILSSTTNLQKLFLRNTQVTLQGAARLKQLLPNLREVKLN